MHEKDSTSSRIFLCAYGKGEINYPAFASASGKRRRGQSEDLDEPDESDYEGYE